MRCHGTASHRSTVFGPERPLHCAIVMAMLFTFSSYSCSMRQACRRRQTFSHRRKPAHGAHWDGVQLRAATPYLGAPAVLWVLEGGVPQEGRAR